MPVKHVDRDGTLYERYGYDARGNRNSITDASGTRTATIDGDDQLTSFGSDVTYSHDAHGQVTELKNASQDLHLGYDGRGNLTSATGGSVDRHYVVDALGRRVAVEAGSGSLVEGFLYQDQLRPAAWIGSDGKEQATFLYLTGGVAPDIIAMADVDSTAYRLIKDERGSVVRVVRVSDGHVMQSISYDPWGRVLSDEHDAGFSQPFGYAGGLTDSATGLDHFGAREYDPTTGQFLTRDPAEDSTGDPYGYAGADPINHVDPSGLNWAIDLATGISSGLSDISNTATVALVACTATIIAAPICDAPLAAIAAASGLASAAIDTTLYETGATSGGAAASDLCSALTKNPVSALGCAALQPAVNNATDKRQRLADVTPIPGAPRSPGYGPDGRPLPAGSHPDGAGRPVGPDGKCTYG